jgi:hypothetical protein
VPLGKLGWKEFSFKKAHELSTNQFAACKQGYQIGRIFACWANVFFGQFFLKLTKSSQNFGLLFNTVKFIDCF